MPRHYREPIELAQLPQNDPPTYRALQRADTVGMFQVESRAQMAALPRNHPTCFYDLVVQVAIIRPGPIVGNMMNPYMKRRRGAEKVSYYHPLLEPVLKRTLGIPLFQEQLIRMAMIVANFTGGEAEELRRAVGMRRSMARMKELEGKLRRGMTANGVPPKVQDEIVQSISSFALYGFPESHAASFALIAYASAYIKCNYLAAFTAALLNNQPMGFYAPATIVKDAQRHGLRVKPVDVQHSGWPCTLEAEPDNPHRFALRLGFCYARGLRREIALALISAREQRPFYLDSRSGLAGAATAQIRSGAAGEDRRAQFAGRSGTSPRCSVAGGVRWPPRRAVVEQLPEQMDQISERYIHGDSRTRKPDLQETALADHRLSSR